MSEQEDTSQGLHYHYHFHGYGAGATPQAGATPGGPGSAPWAPAPGMAPPPSSPLPGAPPPGAPYAPYPYGPAFGAPGDAAAQAGGPAAGNWHRHPGADSLVKGLIIGAGAAYLLTNETAQRTIMRTAVQAWALLQNGIEELKERLHDAEAEAAAATAPAPEAPAPAEPAPGTFAPATLAPAAPAPAPVTLSAVSGS